MSKKKKIIIIVSLVGFFIALGGLFIYIAFKAGFRLMAKELPSDAGKFINCNVENIKTTELDEKILAKPDDTLKFEVVFKSDVNKLYNPAVYFGTTDQNNTNFAKAIAVDTKSLLVNYKPKEDQAKGSDFGFSSHTDKGFSKNFTYNNYNQPAFYWSLLGERSFLKKDSQVTVSFKAKVKYNAKPGTVVRIGWFAGWQGRKQIYSRNMKGRSVEVKIVASPKISSIEPAEFQRSTKTKNIFITVEGKGFSSDVKQNIMRVRRSDSKKWKEYKITKSKVKDVTKKQTLITNKLPANSKEGEYYVQVKVKAGKDNFYSNVMTFTILPQIVSKSIIKGSKFAYNETQKEVAAKVTAQVGDTIKFDLNTWNEGNIAEKSFVIKDNILGIAPYVDVVDTGGGELRDGKIVYPASYIQPSGSSTNKNIVKYFKVKIKPQSQWPKDGYLKITNSYNPRDNKKASTITIKISFSTAVSLNSFYLPTYLFLLTG
jgi:uncharacterized protein (UPF0335 family)